MQYFKNLQQDQRFITLKQDLETWRENKEFASQSIPEGLWKKAANLCRDYSVAMISKKLRLSYDSLKDLAARNIQFKEKAPDFIKIPSNIVQKQQATLELCDQKRQISLKITLNGEPFFDISSIIKIILSVKEPL